MVALAADAVLLLHLLFIVFAVLGGLLVLRWPRLAYLHVPALLWGVTVEWMGWICPLTPLENALRMAAGEQGYSGGFIEHYIWPLIYPAGLTRGTQIVLGFALLAINAVIYGMVIGRARRRARARDMVRKEKEMQC